MAALRSVGGGSQRCVIVEGGPSLAERLATRASGDQSEDALVRGFGGAGLFSDGKLCLSPRIGTTFTRRFDPSEVTARQHAIDVTLRSGEEARLHTAPEGVVARIARQAEELGLAYLHYPVRHVGSDQLPRMLRRLEDRLVCAGAVVRCATRCVTVEPATRGRGWCLTLLDRTGAVTALVARYVVLAPGKVGSTWLGEVGSALDLGRDRVLPKLGFRVEGNKEMLGEIAWVSNDPKVVMSRSGGVDARTHCVCYGGDVVPATYEDVLLVGGHSDSSHSAHRTNTAVVATDGELTSLTPATIREVAREVNRRADGRVASQRLGEFLDTQLTDDGPGFEPSIPDAVHVRLDQIYPAPVVAVLRDFLSGLGALCPGVVQPGNVLYGPAVERWAPRFAVNDDMESTAPGLFLVGDGPGLTGGIIGAAESGWLAGDAIARRLQNGSTARRRSAASVTGGASV